MSFLSLAFTAPLALAGLAALPLIWLLIRITPPRPKPIVFPPLKLILDLKPKDETPARTPWPLLVLRLAIAGLAVLAMAVPVWNPPTISGAGNAPVAVLIDDGWAAAPAWPRRIEAAAHIVEDAGRRGAASAIVVMSDAAREIVPADSARTLDKLRALKPVAFAPDRMLVLPALTRLLEQHKSTRIVWLADGLELGNARAFASALQPRVNAPIEVISDAKPVLALAGARNEVAALEVRVLHAGAQDGAAVRVRAADIKGLTIGETSVTPGVAAETIARFDLPVELRNDIARIEIVGETSAGAVALLDDRWKRRRIGILSGAGADVAQPLLAPNYYLARALGPFADVRIAREGATDPLGGLIDDKVSAIVLADAGVPPGDQRARLDEFLDNGGLVIRFAGTRLAGSSDDLVPVELRRGGRVLGGALSWETPKKLSPFERTSPFYGLNAPEEVSVTRQVLAEPEAGLPAKTWAALADGTPLVTAERRGKGLLVLFHVTADTTWSNLPLSGLFPDMLRKIIALAGQTVAPAEDEDSALSVNRTGGEVLMPVRILDGFGVAGPPSAFVRPIAPNFDGPVRADHPPGLYGPPDALVALNTLSASQVLVAADVSGLGLRALALETGPAIDLRPWLIAAVFALLVLDALASLWLSGGMRRVRRNAVAASLALALALGGLAGVFAPPSAQAAESKPVPRRDVEAALATRLAYIITGDARTDEASRAGLSALSRALSLRTSLSPAEPAGVDPARDELVFYPLIYWPIVAGQPQPNAAAIAKIAAFMKQGGTIVFDTRDALVARPGGPPTPESRWLRQLLSGVDVPELEPVPRDHVVTKTFYLLESFVGRTTLGQTWIEALPPETQGADRPARAGDNVSPIVIVSNDLAAGWAADRNGEPLYPLVPGGARQREMALRAGINLVMYTLTGNYKADQVHVRDLLERLGH